MSSFSETLSAQLGGERPRLRSLMLFLLMILLGLALATNEVTKTLLALIAVSLVIVAIAYRYPWLAVASPLIFFTVFGIGLSADVTLAGANLNLSDILLVLALIPTAFRILAGKISVPHPNLPIVLIGAWLILTTATALQFDNSYSLIRNELHIMIYIPVAFFWAAAEIRDRSYFWKMVTVIIGATAFAGLKAAYISFFVPHVSEGTSNTWQAATLASEQLGGQRTTLFGADTMFVLIIPIIAALMIFAPSRRFRLLLLIPVPIIFFGLLISLTRTNWATVVLALLVVMVIGAKVSGKRTTAMAATIIILGLVIVYVASALTMGSSSYDFGEILQRRLDPNAATGSGNLDYRIREGEALIEETRKHMIIGNGLGADFAFLEFRGPTTVTWAHNGHLWLLLKSGLLGLALFFGAIMAYFWQSRRKFLACDEWFIKAVLLGFAVAIISLLIMSLLVNRISNAEGAYFMGLAFAVPYIAHRLIPAHSQAQGG